MNLFKNGFKVISVLAFLLVFNACKSVEIPLFSSQNVPTAPNYNHAKSWAVLPSKYPKSLQIFASKEIDTLAADVFYVYPTLLLDTKDTRWNTPIHDVAQNSYVINMAVKNQVSPFATVGKIYVPYYRQAHIRAYDRYTNGGKEAFEIAYGDVKNAFEVYLKKYNKGRPIIIVSHSQGTTHTRRLLKELFDNKPLQQQLVAAYIPGMGIRKNEFTQLKAMTFPEETGGFVSWNTRKKNSYPKGKNWFAGRVNSNPITWDRSVSTTRKQHKGFLFTNNKLYTQALTIELTDGMVWTSLPHFPLRMFAVFKKNYHTGDINLFWQDIRENALLRVQTFVAKNSF